MLMLVCTGFVFSSLLFFVAWIVARRLNNYSLVDAVWAFAFVLVAGLFAWMGEGSVKRNLLMLLVVGAWSLRLGYFLSRRIASHHPEEDSRYQTLRVEYGERVEHGFFWFFQYQAWSVVVLCAPFLVIAMNPKPEISLIEWLGAGLFAISLMLESTADGQMKRFKQNPSNRNRTCQIGMWRYSRHPNYFFESINWWGFYLIALGSPGGVVTVFAPLGILFLLLFVTGVPMAEKQALQKRGDEYREYQRTTSRFIPWFVKLCLLITFSISSNAAEVPEQLPSERIADIYPKDNLQKPAFVQKTTYRKTSDEYTEATTVIHDSNDQPVLTEVAVYDGARLVSQSVDQFQSKTHYEVKNKNNDQVFFYRSDLDQKKSHSTESHERMPKNFITGPTTEAFLANNVALLLAGEAVSCRFGVLELRETVGFEFKMIEKTKVGGRKAIRIEMKPSSFFIAMLVKPIQIYLDLEKKRFVKFVGRTPLQRSFSDDQPFDGEILYR
jgi:steroid 5-alpha reductase family enzyme